MAVAWPTRGAETWSGARWAVVGGGRVWSGDRYAPRPGGGMGNEGHRNENRGEVRNLMQAGVVPSWTSCSGERPETPSVKPASVAGFLW